MTVTIPSEIRTAVETLWDFQNMGHGLESADIGIGLGSHDLGVATHTAELFLAGYFPRIVFTGANAPTTVERFPRGEAVHYAEHARNLGVPSEAILIEPRATNTAENIRLTRELLAEERIGVGSAILISRPYQQRRAFATAAKEWPGVRFLCSSLPQSLDDYVAGIGDVNRVVNMLVGDTQRIWVYADMGFAVPQHVPSAVVDAYKDLVERGYVTRLVPRA